MQCRGRLIGIAAWALAACALSCPALAQVVTAPYLPLTLGNSWTYQENGVNGFVSSLTGTQVINGTVTTALTHSDGSAEYFTNDGNGIRQHRAFAPNLNIAGCGIVSETDTFSPPLQFAPTVWSVGQSVPSSGTLSASLGACGTFTFSYSATSSLQAQELVTVPAGQFLASRVEVSLFYSGAAGSASMVRTYWVAPDVGVVKQVENGTDTALLSATNVVRTAADPFSFVPAIGATPSGTAFSNMVTITGMTAAAPISVSGGQYAINGGAWTSSPGTITNGQVVAVSLTTAATPNTQATATLTIGGVAGSFSATTAADTNAPTVPTGLSATAAGLAQINLAWNAATDNFGVTAYKVYRGGILIATLGNVTAFSNTGLAAGTPYSYTVAACDAAGNCSAQSSAASATTAVPSAPGAPGNVTATAGNGLASITFTAPASNGGSPITAYTATASPGGASASGTGVLTVGGLTNGVTYIFTVTATNGIGTGPASAASNAVTPSASPGVTPALEAGFNLLGNALNTTLDVPSLFGTADSPVPGVSENIASVWKWDAGAGNWQFHSPLLSAAGNAGFIAGKGYAALASIGPGEGYWVNALGPGALPLQAGSAFHWNGFSFAGLPSGFNLIAHAGTASPSQFNVNVSAVPPSPGVVPTDNLLSLWAWDAQNGKWFFHSPLLESTGGLPAVKAYADSHFFQHFQDSGKTLGPGVGFWVLRP